MLVDDSHALLEKIHQKNQAGFKARMFAGFTWSWASEKNGNADEEVPDV